MAAFDISDPTSVVSPGGVGFDINCGVRLLRTNLSVTDVEPFKEQLAQVYLYFFLTVFFLDKHSKSTQTPSCKSFDNSFFS